MYRSRRITYINVGVPVGMLVWVSKSGCYENPYNVTGIIKLTGLEEKPKRKI